MHNNFRDGKVHVVSEKCSTCIFRPGNKMHLTPGRVKGMVEEAVEMGGVITCHKTLVNDHDNAICNGYFESYKTDVPILEFADRVDMVVYDEPCQ